MRVFFIVGILLFAPLAHADVASEQAGELYSIEKRDLMGTHEIAAAIGTLPLDAFDKGLTIYGSYTYHFTHLIGWELIGGVYSINFETGLEKELNDRFNVQPEKEGTLDAIIQSNFVLKPFYGKISLFNHYTLTSELFFTVGPALGFFTAASPFGANVGGGIRFFLGKYFSVRFDIRDYLFFPEFKEVDNNLFLSLGLSLTFGFSETTAETEEE